MIHHHHNGGGGRGGAETIVNIQRDKENVTKCLELVKVVGGIQRIPILQLYGKFKIVFDKC